MDGSGSAPAWLFAFVDLAFLLLLGMTQLEGGSLDLGEIVVPRLGADAAEALAPGARQAWQLRVHPARSEGEAPFELIADATPRGEARVDEVQLRERLVQVRDGGAGRPVLAPHADSRSEDLLLAVAALEDVWPGRRRATIRRVEHR